MYFIEDFWHIGYEKVIKEWLFDYDFFSSVMETLRPTTGKTIMGIKRPMYTTLLMLVVTDGVRGWWRSTDKLI